MREKVIFGPHQRLKLIFCSVLLFIGVSCRDKAQLVRMVYGKDRVNVGIEKFVPLDQFAARLVSFQVSYQRLTEGVGVVVPISGLLRIS